MEGARVPAHLGQTTGGAETAARQELFAEKPSEGERESGERLAKQVVDFLVSVCIEAFPDFFGSLGLPRTAEELDGMTPYDLTVAVFSRWTTEKDFVAALSIQTRTVSPEWKRDLLQFCAQAILYKFNILIRRKYRQLFLPAATTTCGCG